MNHYPIHYNTKASDSGETYSQDPMQAEHPETRKKQFIISIENTPQGMDELERMIHDFDNILRIIDRIDQSQTLEPIYRASFSKMAKRLKYRLGPILDGLKLI